MITNDQLIMLDTNIWVYFYAKDALIKYNIILDIIDNNFLKIIISTQILGELYHVLTKKKYLIRKSLKQLLWN